MDLMIKRNRRLVALVCGLLFGSGLFISGMADPAKVIGFLNVAGEWDPSLLFVMAGAFGFYMPVYQLYVKPRINKQKQPVFAREYKIPKTKKIDFKLLSGSAMFGFGWGMAGVCVGPALASLLLGEFSIIFFVLSMIVGIRTACWLKDKRTIEGCENECSEKVVTQSR